MTDKIGHSFAPPSEDEIDTREAFEGCGTAEKFPTLAFALIWPQERGFRSVTVGYSELTIHPELASEGGVDTLGFQFENGRGTHDVTITGSELGKLWRHLLLGKRLTIKENGREVKSITVKKLEKD